MRSHEGVRELPGEVARVAVPEWGGAGVGDRLDRMVAAGARRLELPEPYRFGNSDGDDAAMLRLLAGATTRFLDVRWRLAGDLPWDLPTVVHLTPPSGGVDPVASALAAGWRERYRFGLCTYRYGPGFVLLRDVRPGRQRKRVTLDGPWVAHFRRFAEHEDAAPVPESAVLRDELTEVGLALRCGHERVLLPYRLRRWPVPYETLA